MNEIDRRPTLGLSRLFINTGKSLIGKGERAHTGVSGAKLAFWTQISWGKMSRMGLDAAQASGIWRRKR